MNRIYYLCRSIGVKERYAYGWNSPDVRQTKSTNSLRKLRAEHKRDRAAGEDVSEIIDIHEHERAAP